MKFLVFLFAVVACASAAAVGGYEQQTAITDKVMEIARWTTDNLAAYTNAEGTYTQMTVRNIRTQVVSGINYRFTLDVLLGTPENKYYFQTCEIAVYDQPWTNTRHFLEAPTCKQNPQYPQYRGF